MKFMKEGIPTTSTKVQIYNRQCISYNQYQPSIQALKMQNQKQSSNAQNKNTLQNSRTNTCTGIEQLKEYTYTTGVFDQLINAIKHKDQNIQFTMDVYVNFIDKWIKCYSWKFDLYSLYMKQSQQKQADIMNCLNLYCQLTKKPTLSELYESRHLLYMTLRKYFKQGQGYRDYCRAQLEKKLSKVQPKTLGNFKLEQIPFLKNLSKLLNQKSHFGNNSSSLAKNPKNQNKHSIWSIFSFKKNKYRSNQSLEQQSQSLMNQNQ